MPTNRSRTKRHKRPGNDPDEAGWIFKLKYGRPPTDIEEPSVNPFSMLSDASREDWKQYGPGIMREWLQNSPCTRPAGWWKFESPAERERCGGIGTPGWFYTKKYDVSWGVPINWISQSDVDYLKFQGRYMPGIHAPDPEDPPRFESQAAYLARAGLLTASEWRYLEKHPEILEAETIFAILGEKGPKSGQK